MTTLFTWQYSSTIHTHSYSACIWPMTHSITWATAALNSLTEEGSYFLQLYHNLQAAENQVFTGVKSTPVINGQFILNRSDLTWFNKWYLVVNLHKYLFNLYQHESRWHQFSACNRFNNTKPMRNMNHNHQRNKKYIKWQKLSYLIFILCEKEHRNQRESHMWGIPLRNGQKLNRCCNFHVYLLYKVNDVYPVQR